MIEYKSVSVRFYKTKCYVMLRKCNFFLVPNCPLYYVGAKLSWCQIVRCQIVRFYYVGAKLSWCQIVRCQIVLVPNCPGAKLSGAKLSGAKLSYHPWHESFARETEFNILISPTIFGLNSTFLLTCIFTAEALLC